MKKFQLTSIGLVLSLVIYLVTVILELELFENFISLMHGLEKFEIDEIVIPFVTFLIFAFLDMARKKRSIQIKLEKVKIYKAMLSSTHHILNNFLNQMQLFKITAESTPEFDPEVLSLYDQIMQDASTQIDALSSITQISETSIQDSVAPKLKTNSDT